MEKLFLIMLPSIALADVADGVVELDFSYLETVSGLLLTALGLLFIIRKLIKHTNRS